MSSGAWASSRHLGDKASLTLGYIGNHGVRIPYDNPRSELLRLRLSPFPAFPLLGDLGQLFGDSSAVAQYSSSAVSNYNGLTATFTQRMTVWFHGQANYTWSHAMDEVSNGGIAGTPFQLGHGASALRFTSSTPACLRCNNYGDADYDIRSYFSASYVWQTPWKFGNKFVNGAFGGWTLRRTSSLVRDRPSQ